MNLNYQTSDWAKLLQQLGNLQNLLKTGNFPHADRESADILVKFERQTSEMHKYTFDYLFKP